MFHSILKLKLCRHPCRRRDQIIPTCRYRKNMPTTALVFMYIFFLFNHYTMYVNNWKCKSRKQQTWSNKYTSNFAYCIRSISHSCPYNRPPELFSIWNVVLLTAHSNQVTLNGFRLRANAMLFSIYSPRPISFIYQLKKAYILQTTVIIIAVRD